MSDLEQQIVDATTKALTKAIAETLTGYDNPLKDLVEQVVAKREGVLKRHIATALDAVMDAGDFQEALQDAIRQKLARTLVSKTGGAIEKQINRLRSDPTTQSRITLALETLIEEITGAQA